MVRQISLRAYLFPRVFEKLLETYFTTEIEPWEQPGGVYLHFEIRYVPLDGFKFLHHYFQERKGNSEYIFPPGTNAI